MRLNWNRKYTTIAVYALIIIFLSLWGYSLVIHPAMYLEKWEGFLGIMTPLAVGGGLAYLLNFILKFYESRVFRKKGRHQRKLSVLATYVSVFLVGVLFLRFIFPQLSESILNFVEDFPDYPARLTDFLSIQLQRLNLTDKQIGFVDEQFNKMTERFVMTLENISPILLQNIVSLATGIGSLLIGLVISIYLLFDKERFGAAAKRVVYSFFSPRTSRRIFMLTKRADHIFGRFLVGTFIDALIVGVATGLAMLVFRIPYVIMIGFIVGISNVIPYFGPIIGAVPSAVIIFFVSPMKALTFLIIVMVIQQVDGNFIAPKILGETIGLPPFWILFSTLVFGHLFGIAGMVMGVPTFAFLLSIWEDFLKKRLHHRQLPMQVDDYLDDGVDARLKT